jgi:hypothetical protein
MYADEYKPTQEEIKARFLIRLALNLRQSTKRKWSTHFNRFI